MGRLKRKRPEQETKRDEHSAVRYAEFLGKKLAASKLAARNPVRPSYSSDAPAA